MDSSRFTGQGSSLISSVSSTLIPFKKIVVDDIPITELIQGGATNCLDIKTSSKNSWPDSYPISLEINSLCFDYLPVGSSDEHSLAFIWNWLIIKINGVSYYQYYFGSGEVHYDGGDINKIKESSYTIIPIVANSDDKIFFGEMQVRLPSNTVEINGVLFDTQAGKISSLEDAKNDHQARILDLESWKQTINFTIQSIKTWIGFSQFSSLCNAVSACTPVISCTTNSQCGTDGFIGDRYCIGNDIYRNQRNWTCMNPGTPQSTCSFSDNKSFISGCMGICNNGNCTSEPATRLEFTGFSPLNNTFFEPDTQVRVTAILARDPLGNVECTYHARNVLTNEEAHGEGFGTTSTLYQIPAVISTSDTLNPYLNGTLRVTPYYYGENRFKLMKGNYEWWAVCGDGLSNYYTQTITSPKMRFMVGNNNTISNVVFRTDVTGGNYYNGCTLISNCWIAMDTNNDGNLEALGFDAKSTSCHTGTTLVKTPENYNVVYYGSAGKYGICVNGKEARFSVARIPKNYELSKTPTEPYQSNGQETYS